MHQLHCQILCRAAAGSLLNPRVCSCFNEESFIGSMCQIAKGTVHGSTVGLRTIQRWMLQLNSRLCAELADEVEKEWL